MVYIFFLVEGDKLNKFLSFQGYLNVNQLPRQVQICRHTRILEILEENLYDDITLIHIAEIIVELQMGK